MSTSSAFTIHPDQYIQQLSQHILRHLASLTNSHPPSLFSSTFNLVTRPSNHLTSILTLNPHHLYYLLLKFDSQALLSIPLDHLTPIHPSNPDSSKAYHPTRWSINFNPQSPPTTQNDPSDATSLFSNLSITSSSSLWSSKLSPTNLTSHLISTILSTPQFLFGIQPSAHQPNLSTPQDQLIFLYSTFTKLPSLCLSPSSTPSNSIQKHSHSSKIEPMQLIDGFTDLPNHHLVPLNCFRSLWSLYVHSLDPRLFSGWLQLSQNLRSLEIRRSGLEDLENLLIDAVLDDIHRDEKREADRIDVAAEQLSQQPPRELGPLTQSIASSINPQPDPSSDSLPPGFPTLSWAFLQHLCLADNSFTFLSTKPLRALTSLVSLDLSSNLLIAIPAGLQNLPRLKLLNLSDNMIDSVIGIYHILPSTTAINLSRNRLTSLCGIENLTSLERLDIRANLLQDISETSRLATLPKLTSLWASDNPFCSLNPHQHQHHSDWRIEIFNYFSLENREIDRPQSSSSASEIPTLNLKLENLFPTYSERKFIQKPIRKSHTPEQFTVTDPHLKKTFVKSPHKKNAHDRLMNKKTRHQQQQPSSNPGHLREHQILDSESSELQADSSSCHSKNKRLPKIKKDKSIPRRRKQPRLIELDNQEGRGSGEDSCNQSAPEQDQGNIETERQEEGYGFTLSERKFNSQGKVKPALEIATSINPAISNNRSPPSNQPNSPHCPNTFNHVTTYLDHPSILRRPHLNHLGSSSANNSYRSNSMDSSGHISFRNKIEALKSELGDDAWLRVLSETEFGRAHELSASPLS